MKVTVDTEIAWNKASGVAHLVLLDGQGRRFSMEECNLDDCKEDLDRFFGRTIGQALAALSRRKATLCGHCFGKADD
jgi:hypothetical protein